VRSVHTDEVVRIAPELLSRGNLEAVHPTHRLVVLAGGQDESSVRGAEPATGILTGFAKSYFGAPHAVNPATLCCQLPLYRVRSGSSPCTTR